MQKILLFVLVILIVNVQSVDVYTQASVDKLVADAKAVAAAAKGKAAASKQADVDAQALATSDKNLVGPLKTTLTADYAAQKLTQDSYNLQLTATTDAQTLADSKRALLATAHTNVDANNVVVAALEARKTAMTYSSTDLDSSNAGSKVGLFAAAVTDAGTKITALQTQAGVVKTFVDGKVTAIGANPATAMNNAKSAQDTAEGALVSGADAQSVCKASRLTTYVDAVAAYITAGVAHSTNAAALTAYQGVLGKLSTELTAKVTPLLQKQQAVLASTTLLKLNLNAGTSAISSIQKIINAEQTKVQNALNTANAKTLTLATALSAANSVATSSDSLWLQAQQLLATQLSALNSAMAKSETQQSLYDARNKAWMKSQAAAYATGNTRAVDAAAEKMANDMVALTTSVQASVNVALAKDKASAAAALQVVETKAASVTAAAAAKAREVATAATAAAAAGVTSLKAAVTAEVTAQKKLDNTTAIAWNKSLKGDATAAKAACAAQIKKAKDANKSSTKLNFSVLSLIAGLLIMTMN